VKNRNGTIKEFIKGLILLLSYTGGPILIVLLCAFKLKHESSVPVLTTITFVLVGYVSLGLLFSALDKIELYIRTSTKKSRHKK